MGRQLHADLEHVLAEECDPRRAVSLLEVAAGGQRRAAVKDADVVQSKEAAFKEVLAKAIFAVHPPAEVQHQLRKRPPEEFQVGFALERLFRPVHEDGSHACTGGLTSLKFHS